MGKLTMSADQMTEKWARRAKQATQDVIDGVNRVTENPATKAIAKKEKMITNLTASVRNGRWEKGLGQVTLEDWKAKTSQKVQERYSGGIEAAIPKRAKFDQYLVPTLKSGQDKVNSMPDMTLEDNIARSAAMQRHMAANPYKGKK